VLEGGQFAKRVLKAAGGKTLGGDLGTHGVEARGAVLEERRAGRQGQELRQDVAERVAHGDRSVGPANPDVNVDAEAVVAPDDVLQEIVVPPVVRRVDDALVLPAAPGMSAGRREPDSETIG